MANVFDVASYILDKLGDMTAMKLQKLCYYSQAWNLVWEEKPIFAEEFQAWANGPVCPDLFYAHRGQFTVSMDLLSDKLSQDSLSDENKENIGKVLNFYGEKTPIWLSNLTHQELPWLSARKGYDIGESSAEIISKESMQQYYAGLS